MTTQAGEDANSKIPFQLPEGTEVEKWGPRSGSWGPYSRGVQLLVRFRNGRGASVVRGFGTYGAEDGLWELAVLTKAGSLDYTTPITSNVEGRLTAERVSNLLQRIAELPAESGA